MCMDINQSKYQNQNLAKIVMHNFEFPQKKKKNLILIRLDF